ncbi:MAG: hypothetical protein U0X39_01390 [Bacteroidales bacterium]
MEKHIYLTINPEAMIGSMMPPEDFGHYMATGTKKSNKSQVIFFELDFEQARPFFNNAYLEARCVRKADGSPKSSVYLSIYRVLEVIPLSALLNLYVTSDHGHVLRLDKAPYDTKKEARKEMHLYQELCPVSPMVASNLTPVEFLEILTDGSLQIKLPKLFFADLKLGELAYSPLHGSADDLPYQSVSHLRDCLEIIKTEDMKQMKTVHRIFSGNLLYRTIDTGFYVGAGKQIVFYPFPSMEEIKALNFDFYKAI